MIQQSPIKILTDNSRIITLQIVRALEMWDCGTGWWVAVTEGHLSLPSYILQPRPASADSGGRGCLIIGGDKGAVQCNVTLLHCTLHTNTSVPNIIYHHGFHHRRPHRGNCRLRLLPLQTFDSGNVSIFVSIFLSYHNPDLLPRLVDGPLFVPVYRRCRGFPWP